MQPCFFIKVLVLQSKRLVRILVNPLIFFQTTPGGVFAEPQEVAVDVGHLSWDVERIVGVAAVKYGTKKDRLKISNLTFWFFS